jgi:hypothetical protein
VDKINCWISAMTNIKFNPKKDPERNKYKQVSLSSSVFFWNYAQESKRNLHLNKNILVPKYEP